MPDRHLWLEHVFDNYREIVKTKERETQVVQEKLDRLQIACYGLLNYCQHNTLNFQREKLDDYLRNIERIMEENQK